MGAATAPASGAAQPAPVKRPRPIAVFAHPDRCTLCESCLDACPRGALSLHETAEGDAALCTGCGACMNACPNDVFAPAEA